MKQFFSAPSDLENSSEFLCSFTDTNFRFLDTNRLFQKQFNLNENWKGQPFLEAVHTFQMEKFLQANNECLKNPEKTLCIEIQTITDMQESWFRWEVSAVLNDHGKVEGTRFLGTDITKQKKAEQTLLQYAILLDNISDAIVSADKDFCIKNWNLKAGAIFSLKHGTGLNSVVTHEIKEINFINDSAINFKKALINKGTWNGNIIIEKNDGNKFYMQTMVNPVKDNEGKTNGFVCIGRDVTNEYKEKDKFISDQNKSQLDLARKQSADDFAVNVTSQVKETIEIEKQRNQFQSFMENAPLLAWITDADGVLYYMNSQFKNAYNYTDDYLNKKIGSVAGLNENEKALLPYKNVLVKNKSAEFFHEFIDKKKKVHYYRTFKFPIKTNDGKMLEGGQSIEITGELITQRELEKSNELFEYAGKATRDVIWDWNIKENKIRRTSGYESIYGYKISEEYETQGYERIHGDYIDEVLKISGDALKGDNTRWHMEYKYLCADGSYKNVIDQAYIIRDKNGKAVRVIGSMADVTEERNLQNQVFKTEIQKKKDVINAVINAQEKERHELSAELHDNVNQLLAASILYLKTARKQDVIEEELISQSQEYVEKAVNEIRSISHNLIPGDLKLHGLSSALKALTGKLQIPKTFEIKLVCEKIDENKIEHPLQLAVYRIVQESINNILKHANATQVSISLCEEDNHLALTVTDNGKGFDTLTIKKGFGIINIYNRAENLGGTAEVISSPGKGCTWQIKIPVV